MEILDLKIINCMAIKKYRPYTPSRRHMTTVDSSGLAKKKPEKAMVSGFRRAYGRSRGRISVRHKGAGAKRLYRFVDFHMEKHNVPARIEALEYDPNRSAFIALLLYRDGERRYMIAPHGIRAGDEIIASEKAPLRPGNRLPLREIPVGTFVYNIELLPNTKATLVRSAGSTAQVLAHEGIYVHLLMPSKEIRRIHSACWASIGAASNPDHATAVIGKAGRNRRKGVRPTVRGSAMNPVDHPHGGGEGRTGIGLKHPKTPWGKIARGVKTRRKKKISTRFIVRRRIKK